MVNLQIRNVPEETHSVLRRRASEAGMPLQEYLLALLRCAEGLDCSTGYRR